MEKKDQYSFGHNIEKDQYSFGHNIEKDQCNFGPNIFNFTFNIQKDKFDSNSDFFSQFSEDVPLFVFQNDVQNKLSAKKTEPIQKKKNMKKEEVNGKIIDDFLLRKQIRNRLSAKKSRDKKINALKNLELENKKNIQRIFELESEIMWLKAQLQSQSSNT